MKTQAYAKFNVTCIMQEAERLAMDMRARCEVCAGGPIDREMMDRFRLAVCWPCKRADVTDNYKLITKTTARTDFLLTDKELDGARVLFARLMLFFF